VGQPLRVGDDPHLQSFRRGDDQPSQWIDDVGVEADFRARPSAMSCDGRGLKLPLKNENGLGPTLRLDPTRSVMGVVWGTTAPVSRRPVGLPEWRRRISAAAIDLVAAIQILRELGIGKVWPIVVVETLGAVQLLLRDV
jgi:hypothetical protein